MIFFLPPCLIFIRYDWSWQQEKNEWYVDSYFNVHYAGAYGLTPGKPLYEKAKIRVTSSCLLGKTGDGSSSQGCQQGWAMSLSIRAAGHVRSGALCVLLSACHPSFLSFSIRLAPFSLDEGQHRSFEWWPLFARSCSLRWSIYYDDAEAFFGLSGTREGKKSS